MGELVSENATVGSNFTADQFRRWMLIVGFVLGAWGVAQVATQLATVGSPFEGWQAPPFWPLRQIFRVDGLLWIALPFLLLVGCFSVSRGLAWGRIALLVYAYGWLFMVTCLQLTKLYTLLTADYRDLSGGAFLADATGYFDLLIYSSVYPAFVIWSMGRKKAAIGPS